MTEPELKMTLKPVCLCGHPFDRHVRSSLGKLYCVEQGCHCGDYWPETDALKVAA